MEKTLPKLPRKNCQRIYLVAYRHFRVGSGRKVFPVEGGNGKALIQLVGGSQGSRIYDANGVSCTLAAEGGGKLRNEIFD